MKKEKYEPEPNDYKWSSIELTIHSFKVKEFGENPAYLAEKLFKQPVCLSEKYDGTNVGVDEDGNLYGRN